MQNTIHATMIIMSANSYHNYSRYSQVLQPISLPTRVCTESTCMY